MADKNVLKNKQAGRRRQRVRTKVHGTAEIPRLTVARSLKNVFVQIVDDEKMMTLVALSSNGKEFDAKAAAGTKTAVAKEVGKKLAEIARAKGIESVVFDRNRARFHGRVKAVADGAREGGLKF